MLKINNYVYVPGNYFGIEFSDKFNINVDTSVIVGIVNNTKPFTMSGYTWINVYWFLTNQSLWIDLEHLTKLPINSNIIYGLTYITESNRDKFIIKNNQYWNNILHKIKKPVYKKTNNKINKNININPL